MPFLILLSFNQVLIKLIVIINGGIMPGKNLIKKNRLFYAVSILFLSLMFFSFMAIKNVKNSDSATSYATTEEFIKNLSNENNINYDEVKNPMAYITSQCYTKTTADNGKVYNPCYACHQRGKEPNYLDDSAFQTVYEFPETGEKNPWTNLFKDKTQYVNSISDEQILSYVRQNNYFDASGNIYLANTLPQDWAGYRPDCWFAFDAEGFDKNPNSNEYTGWRAFRYYPFLGTFWPTNGSTDDVMIRLATPFRQDADGRFNNEIYKINLAITEAVVKQKSVKTEPLDEKVVNRDLDGNGEIAIAYSIKYDWRPLENVFMYYVGIAETLQKQGLIHLAGGLYPDGTEFLHTVRYIDWDETKNSIKMASRMKEVRYAKKVWWANYAYLQYKGNESAREIFLLGEIVPESFIGNYQYGIESGTGWVYQGFIEDKKGNLRPQTNEENVNCMGCHSMIGATTDTTFAFARKFEGQYPDETQYGWMHWSQKGLDGVNEPKIKLEDGSLNYEYSYYLIYNDSGNEFRSNDEVKAKFFNADGSIKSDMLEKLHDDITVLLYPSRERAMMLNKAYKAIVDEQSFILGRDATVNPVANIHKEVEQGEATGVTIRTNSEFIGNDLVRTIWGATYRYWLPKLEYGFQTLVTGLGMSGPNGYSYGSGIDGVIAKSAYTTNIEGYHLPFPTRLTIPTRTIVTNGNIPACYKCHRIEYPGPSKNVALIDPKVNFPATLDNGVEAGKIAKLTTDAKNDIGGKWSPDGSKIAYISYTSGAPQIWTMDSAGNNKMPITQGPMIYGWHEWSPDGKKFVFWGYDESSAMHYLMTSNADGTGKKIIRESSEILDRPMWSPDGLYIAYGAVTSGNWDVWVSKADGSDPIRLTTNPDMESNPLWRPDGKGITYKLAPSGKYGLTVENYISFENGLYSPVFYTWNGPESVQANNWSRDGKKLAYTTEVINQAGGEDRVTYVAMVSDVSISGNIYKANNTIILSKGMTLGDRGPVISPDGTKAAFWGWDQAYRATLWVYNLTNHELKQLTSAGNDMYPQWSPDSKKLLFDSIRDGNMDIWLINVE